MTPLRLFLIAGEPSGDRLGAALIRGLRTLSERPVVLTGIGGEAMAAEGLASRFPMAELSLVGVAEVLPHLPRLIRRLDETTAAIRAERPDALVTIDAPSFCLRIAGRLAGAGIPRIHYVAPQLWAWRPGRARKLAHSIDRLLALLPFEPEFFAGYGIDCQFVGHPVIERSAGDGAGFRARHGLAGDQPLLCLLPGSRRGEIQHHLELFGAVAARMAAQLPGLALVLPTIAPVLERVRSGLAGWPKPPLLVVGEQGDAFAAADAALAASGTVALELALAGTPTVVTYRANPLTAAIVQRLVTVPHVALPNLIAGRRVMPELIQKDATVDSLSAALLPLLQPGPAREAQRDGLANVATALGAGGEAPSLRAARAVLAAAGGQ